MAVLFANVTDVRIPQGDVTKITDSDNVTLWQKQRIPLNVEFSGLDVHSSNRASYGKSGYIYKINDTPGSIDTLYKNPPVIPTFKIGLNTVKYMKIRVYDDKGNPLKVTGGDGNSWVNKIQWNTYNANVNGVPDPYLTYNITGDPIDVNGMGYYVKFVRYPEQSGEYEIFFGVEGYFKSGSTPREYSFVNTYPDPNNTAYYNKTINTRATFVYDRLSTVICIPESTHSWGIRIPALVNIYVE